MTTEVQERKRPVLRLYKVRKTIGGKDIVKGLSFDVNPGEVFGFLGPNGAGKTTTIRMMVGLMSISGGDIEIMGTSIAKDQDKALRHVGAIVENPELFKFLSGYKNLKHFARMVPDVTAERISEVVRLVMAENGQAAVDKAAELRPDLVLMDIHMPVMNGVEATALIKQQWPEVKVMMLTTFQEVEYVITALNAGAEGYILKAIDPEDLAGAIRLVHRGETLITQEVAKSLFSRTVSERDKPQGVSKASEYGLTDRELQVLQYISEGLTNRSIAERMFLSEGTVKNYISSIYSKLNVHNRASVMRKASEEGLF